MALSFSLSVEDETQGHSHDRHKLNHWATPSAFSFDFKLETSCRCFLTLICGFMFKSGSWYFQTFLLSWARILRIGYFTFLPGVVNLSQHVLISLSLSSSLAQWRREAIHEIRDVNCTDYPLLCTTTHAQIFICVLSRDCASMEKRVAYLCEVE